MKKHIITLILAFVSVVAYGQRYSDYLFPERIENYKQAINCFEEPKWQTVLEEGMKFEFYSTSGSILDKCHSHQVIDLTLKQCIEMFERQTKKDGIARDTSKLKQIMEYHRKKAEMFYKEQLEKEAAEKKKEEDKFSKIEKDLFGW